MKKRILSLFLAIIMAFTAIAPFTAFAEEPVLVSKSADLKKYFSDGGNIKLAKDFSLSGATVAANISVDGDGKTLSLSNDNAPAMIHQKGNASSSFSNLTIAGSDKHDVGIWIESGKMSFNDCKIQDFNILDGRFSFVGMVGSSTLTLNNTEFINNKNFDIVAYDGATININEGTKLDNVRLGSIHTKINIGSNWNSSFNLSLDYPVSKVIGTVGNGADVSKINVTNSEYYVENENGKLVIKRKAGTSIQFDMAKREKLYKGSTGFLYGASEINVPTIDLLQGLKPDTMVQKAVGGLQHPTGDAVRTGSALISAGVRDMQIYIQDNYLEWPYDAPMKDGKVDIDAYQVTVEKIVRKMICDSNGNVNKSVADKYSFVLFNEPDQIWFGWDLVGLENAWKQIYNAVKRIYPNARCVGPNFSGFDADRYDKFLAFCKENDCLPEIISWHELGEISLVDFEKHYNAVVSDVEKYYPAGQEPELMVNEYARHYDIGSVGGLVKWLAMFEDKDMCGCMAYWAMANSLNEMAADQNNPNGSWWVYHWYAQMTGAQCPITYPNFEDSKFYGVASYDEKENMGYILFGGSEDDSKQEIVYANNLSSTDLLNNKGAVNVKIYGVGFSGQQGASYKPEVIFDGAVQTTDGSLKIQLNDVEEMDAYFAILTKAEDSAEISSMENAGISTISYEAENATLLGNARAYSKWGWTEFATSGRADVGNLNNNSSGVQFDVEVSENGTYNVSLFYSLQSPFVDPYTLEPKANGQNRGIGKSLPYGVIVDGVKQQNITLESTVTWYYKNHVDIELPLTAGKHKITFMHINGDESQKGNLQLTAALDKLDLTKVDDNKNNFEIDLTEMSNFKTENGYKVTAVAPVAGYYNIVADGNVELTKQAVDYAKDAKTTSPCSTYDIPVGKTVYLSQGANTIGVVGKATKLEFIKVSGSETTIFADEITLHGNVPAYKSNSYANSKKVIAELGVGQTGKEKYTQNYAYFDVVAQDEGYYNLAIRYTNDEPAPVMKKANGDAYVHPYNIDLVERYAQIVVNNAEPETVYFRNTMSWDSFRIVDVQVKLNKGTNRIKLYNDNSYQFSELVNSTAPEIDEVKISKLTKNENAVQKVKKTSTSKHNYKITTVNPTCVKAGKKSYVCSDCGYSYSVTINATGVHSYTAVVTTKAICGKAGVKTYTCSICGKQKIETIKATGKHSYDSGKLTKKPTSSATGTITYTCKTCKATKKETVSKLSKASISKLTATKKGFKASWKKVSSATGYQIQYSTSSKFSNAKTVSITKNSTISKSVSKLKAKKKYYVRIRTYRTVKGTKCYSSWSKSKTVTTKK